MDKKEENRLKAEHAEGAIEKRLQKRKNHGYLGDAILGAIDGSVSTFAVIAGAAGGGFSSMVVIILGFANLVADGFSMAISNYLRTRSDREQVDRARHNEERHIDVVPDGERLEIRKIFAQKGFQGELLDKLVDGITQNRKLWVNTMLVEEHGLQIEGPAPFHAGLVTFAAFVVVGIIPLLPFLLTWLAVEVQFAISSITTGLTFLLIGIIKGMVMRRSPLRSGAVTFLAGGGAAVLAYSIGLLLRNLYGS